MKFETNPSLKIPGTKLMSNSNIQNVACNEHMHRGFIDYGRPEKQSVRTVTNSQDIITFTSFICNFTA